MSVHPGVALRHCEPFLFADSLAPLAENAGVETTYRYTGDEYFFAGHFASDPVVPGVLLVEAMAQASRLALVWRVDRLSFGHLVAINRARFNQIVRPPATVRFVAKITDMPDSGDGGFFSCSCAAFAGRERVARADLTLSARNPIPGELEAHWPGRDVFRRLAETTRIVEAPALV